jgi:CRP-like cAMP-binding protein
MHPASDYLSLDEDDFKKIAALATRKNYRNGELIFKEGDAADCVYFIESGHVSVYLRKFATKEEICLLGPEDYFGEMALFSKNRRTASVSAATDVSVLSMDKSVFLELIRIDNAFSDKIQLILGRRQAELVLREKLVNITGMKERHFWVGIEGDPSLRQTVHTRQKFESMVDRVLPLLVPRLVDLLVNRCVYQISLACNSGEVRISTILDPFNEEVHQANKLIDEAYINRHFAEVPYDEKSQVIKSLYMAISDARVFGSLPAHLKEIFRGYYKSWEPVNPAVIANALSKLAALRSISDYYLRNVTISTVQDSIRMQFNCDGTNIVSADDSLSFIDAIS